MRSYTNKNAPSLTPLLRRLLGGGKPTMRNNIRRIHANL